MALTSDFGGTYTGPKKKYPQLTEGIHEATLVGVIDKGTKETDWGPKRQIMFKWEGDESYVDEGEEKAVTIVKTYNWTMGKGDKRSKLREDVEAIVGQKLTDNEARVLDLETLIGKRNQIVVEHNGDYANVTKILKAKAAKGVMTEAEVLKSKEMFTT